MLYSHWKTAAGAILCTILSSQQYGAVAFSPARTPLCRHVPAVNSKSNVYNPPQRDIVTVLRSRNDDDDRFLGKVDPVLDFGIDTLQSLWEGPVNVRSLIIAGIILYGIISSVVIVNVGEIGIVSSLGTIEKFDPGFHVKYPWTSVHSLSTKTQLLEQSNFVPTQEGLTVELDTAILYRLDPTRALDLYSSVGPDYVNKLVEPEASSSVRGLTAESEAKALYTSGRSAIRLALKDELSERLGSNGIVVDDVLLKNVVLPKDLSDSIQQKARAEQESGRMEFVLQKEQLEAQRKAIEAEGIAEFQRIVSKGITPSLLQWKGIEATERIAESPNSKVVIVGNDKNSLPVILGSEK